MTRVISFVRVLDKLFATNSYANCVNSLPHVFPSVSDPGAPKGLVFLSFPPLNFKFHLNFS